MAWDPDSIDGTVDAIKVRGRMNPVSLKVTKIVDGAQVRGVGPPSTHRYRVPIAKKTHISNADAALFDFNV